MVSDMSNNLGIWNSLARTDPAHTKGFKRGGGFTGTAIKPIYTEQKMTGLFGPIGIGWGVSEPTFQLVPGENKEVMVYCWLTLWVVRDGMQSAPIPGVGGDKVITHIRANEQYKKPERWDNDDEAFKKAFTDAVGNAMKHLGMSADVHMGLFDDSKYVRQVEQDIRAESTTRQTASVTTITKPAPKVDPDLETNRLVQMGDEAAAHGVEILGVFLDGLTDKQFELIGGSAKAKAWAGVAKKVAQADQMQGAA